MKMRPIQASGWLCCLALMVILVGRHLARATTASESGTAGAVLTNTCLITNDVRRLTDFYAHVLQREPKKESEDYVEFRTGAGTLALFAAQAQEKYIPSSATPAQNRSAILEFRVNDPDREYLRLRDFVQWVKGPTTQPWGTRSIYFRDPDGNLVDFFAPVQSR